MDKRQKRGIKFIITNRLRDIAPHDGAIVKVFLLAQTTTIPGGHRGLSALFAVHPHHQLNGFLSEIAAGGVDGAVRATQGDS